MGEGYQVLGSSFTATIMIKPIFFALTLALAGAFPAEIKPEALLVQQIVKEVPYHMPINQAYHMPFDQQYHLQANANRFGILEVPYHLPINQEYHMPIDQQYHLQANNNRVSVLEVPYPVAIDQQYHLQMNNNRLNLEVPTGSKNQVQKPIVYVLLNSIPQNIVFLRPSERSGSVKQS